MPKWVQNIHSSRRICKNTQSNVWETSWWAYSGRPSRMWKTLQDGCFVDSKTMAIDDLPAICSYLATGSNGPRKLESSNSCYCHITKNPHSSVTIFRIRKFSQFALGSCKAKAQSEREPKDSKRCRYLDFEAITLDPSLANEWTFFALWKEAKGNCRVTSKNHTIKEIDLQEVETGRIPNSSHTSPKEQNRLR